jgi:fructosamine-3-kinase
VSERVVAEGVEAALGERLHAARSLGGGCIGEVYRAELSDGSVVVAKVDREAEANLDREAYMLRYLREKSELPVPEVYHGSETLLLMEFIEGSNQFSRGAERHAADLLAALHEVTEETYGHERDTLIGSLDQPNPPTESWVDFFREQRLLYLVGVAHRAGRLPTEDRRRVDLLADRLDTLIEPPGRPTLIHGDAWRGNVLAKGGRITGFLDPAIYYADPEIELAFISLFNSFGEPFFERYEEVRGIRPGFFETRRDLYNLYPLLVHVYFFGGGYLSSVRSTLDRFGV